MSNKNLSIKLKIDADGNVSGVIKKASKNVDDFGKSATKAGTQTDKLSSSIKKVGHYGATAFVGWGLSVITTDIIKATASFQKLQASLVTVTGSSLKAEQAFSQIKEFAKTTPFLLNEVTESFIKMQALGLTASERAMISYGDTASSMGKSLNQMVEAVADAATGEFERLKEFGIKASSQDDRVTFTFKGVATEIGKNAKEIEDYLIDLGEINFAGGMERQMDTVGGKLSNLEGAWESAFASIGNNAAPAINSVIAGLTNTAETIEDLSEHLDDLAYVAIIGLHTAIIAKAVPALYAYATATTVANTASKGFLVTIRALGAFMFTNPLGLALTAMGAGVAYLTITESAAEKASRELTSALEEQNIKLSKSEMKLKTAELVTYTQQLEALIQLKKQNTAVDVFDKKQQGLERKIANIKKGKSADYDEAFDFDKIEAIFSKLHSDHDDLIKKRDDAENAHLDLMLENASVAQQAMTKAWESSNKERLTLQNQLNQLTLTETQQRALILNGLHTENRALQQRIWHIEDAKKAEKELSAIMDAQFDDAIAMQDAMVQAWGQRQNDAYDMRVNNQWEDDNAEFDRLDAQDLLLQQTLDMANAVDSYGDAWTRTGDKTLDALGSMATMMAKVSGSDLKYSEQLTTLKNEGLQTTDEYIKLEKSRAKNSVKGSMEMLKASSAMFKQGSKEQELAHKASLTMSAIEIGMELQKQIASMTSAATINAANSSTALTGATASIASSGTGDPYTAPFRVVAMTAMMAGVLSQVGLSLGVSSAPSAIARQEQTGSGVLGGGTSNSIENSLSYLDEIGANQYTELQGIHLQTKRLNDSIGNAVASLFRTDEFHSIGTGYSEVLDSGLLNTMNEDVFNIVTLGLMQGLGESVGNLSNSIFGGKVSANQSAYGINAGGTMGDAGLSGYSDVSYKKDGGWFGKSKKWTETSFTELEMKNQTQLNLIFDSMSNQAIELGNALDMNVANQVSNTDIIIGKINATGSTEEIEKKFTEAFNKQSDHLIDSVFESVIEDYKKMGEASAETLSRIVTNKVAVEDILAMTTQYARGDVVALADSLVTLAGGLSELKESADSYYDNFYSETEKSARNQMLLTDALNDQGLALSENRDGYRQLLESLDLSTEKGLQQYNTLLNMNEQADKYYDNLEARQEELYKSQLEGINQTISTLGNLKSTLQDTLDSLTGSVTVSSVSYMNAQSTIFDALASARSGSLPELDSIRQALLVVSANDMSNYATLADYNFDQKVMANAVAELNSLVGVEVSYQDKTLSILEAIKDGVTLESSGLIRAISSGFSNIDANLSGGIDFSEFTNFFGDFATASQMQTMFDGLDFNADGVITVAELQRQSSLLNSVSQNTLASALASGVNNSISEIIENNGGNSSGSVAGAGALEDRSLRDLMRTALALKTSESFFNSSRMKTSYNELFNPTRMFSIDKETLKNDYIGWINEYGVDGSHADGLASVPFDNYRANLHKGESVIDASTMRGFRKYGIPIGNNGSNNAKLEQLLESINNKLNSLGNDDDSKHQIVSSLVDIKDTLEEWNVVGMPAPQEQLQ